MTTLLLNLIDMASPSLNKNGTAYCSYGIVTTIARRSTRSECLAMRISHEYHHELPESPRNSSFMTAARFTRIERRMR